MLLKAQGGCEKLASNASAWREVADGTVCDEVVAIATTEEQNVADAASQWVDALLVYFSQPQRAKKIPAP